MFGKQTLAGDPPQLWHFSVHSILAISEKALEKCFRQAFPIRLGSRLASLFLILLASQPLAAADYFVTPNGAGKKNASSWEHAAPQSMIEELVNGTMAGGDALRLGSGVYPRFSLSIHQGGEPGRPKTIMGVDRGEGLPLLRGEWDLDRPDKGSIGLRLKAGVSNLRFVDLQLSHHKVAVSLRPVEKGAEPASSLTFSRVLVSHVRHGYYLEDGIDLDFRDCETRRYSKHGFRFEGGCHRVKLIRCVADCSEGDEEWEKKTELFPFGFNATNGGAPQSNFTFEDCVARNNRMPLQKTSYKNGDGFVIEGGVAEVTLSRCLAWRNQDGGFDLKSPGVSLIDCIAMRNSRGFRVWNGGSLTNCFSGANGLGLWVNSTELVEVEGSTFYKNRVAALQTDDRSVAGIEASNCLFAENQKVSRKTSRGPVRIEASAIGDDEEPILFQEPNEDWLGDSSGMDSMSHPALGYRYPGSSE
ncbi:MAG: right-handed parallel beta-helix repeat-containing protein [Verrucomicrobiota bacterium JB023]|nr:right-handed parallel beta-helix repeat-containing protein [Verrucomicrobiota bacterium JB023]